MRSTVTHVAPWEQGIMIGRTSWTSLPDWRKGNEAKTRLGQPCRTGEQSQPIEGCDCSCAPGLRDVLRVEGQAQPELAKVSSFNREC